MARDSNFIHGLPVNNLDSIASGNISLSDADRVRLVHDYITRTTADGGLAVVPRAEQWSRVTNIMAIHDQEFNERWLKAWSTHGVGSVDLDKIKDHVSPLSDTAATASKTTFWLQFGEEAGLYFHFLATYAKALTLIAATGSGFWLFGASYSPYYSVVLVLWATCFVEYWKIVERKLSVRWGTYGAFRVEKLRHDYVGGDDSPLQKDLRKATRVAASIPVILGFVAVLGGILTTLFAIEAFVSRLYAGPLHQHVVSKTFDDQSLGLTTLLFVPQGPFQHDPLHGFRTKFPRGVPKVCHQTNKPRKPQTPIDLRLFFDHQTIHPLSDRSLPRSGALRVRVRPVRTTDHDLRPLATQHSTWVERDS